MKVRGIWAALLLMVGLAGYASAQSEPAYTIRRVITNTDQPKCAADGGRGALVFELDSAGQPTSTFEAFCLLPVKGK